MALDTLDSQPQPRYPPNMAPAPLTNTTKTIKPRQPTPDDLERVRQFQLAMVRQVNEASIALERLTRALAAGAGAFEKAFNKELLRKPRRTRNVKI